MSNPKSPMVTVSIVSHGQGEMVYRLLEGLANCPLVYSVILTYNIPERDIKIPEKFSPKLILIRNSRPLGFAANHNQAFRDCNTSFFAVLNPDVILTIDPFPLLVEVLSNDTIGAIGPEVRNPKGCIDDSVRFFPTLLSLLNKFVSGEEGRIVPIGLEPQPVEWVAGMFMLFKSNIFRKINGFDEGFFLYYEDVDICIRLWTSGYPVYFHPSVSVIHIGQRTSRRKFRYMVWHFLSMTRYLIKYAWRLPYVKLH